MTISYDTNAEDTMMLDDDMPDEKSYKAKLLVVEDDTHLLAGIRDILELEDYNVLTASNGKRAIELMREDTAQPPDLIVSDIMMPHMDGFQFLEEVRKEDKWVTVPFIFLTAKGERTDRHKGRNMGADVYLTKPFDAEDLLMSVKASLKRHQNITRVKNSEIIDNKRKILTILNHEFRTPLTLVVAYAEMLKDFEPETMSDGEIVSFLRGVNSGADRLRRLVENFITLVELDSGEAAKTIAWRKRPVDDLTLVVEDAQRQVALPDRRPREFVLNVQEDLPTVTLDVQYMTIAIRELLDNAAKFCNEGDTITLTARQVNDAVEISISDPGRGVPENEFANIWQQFYQIDREHYEDQGSGSGLAIVRAIVELHGGSYRLKSTLGEGSTFTIRLPLEPSESAT